MLANTIENPIKTTKKLNLKYLAPGKPKKEFPLFLFLWIFFCIALCILAIVMIVSQERPDIIYHKVKEGETLRGLALKYYQNDQEWSKIFLANREQLKKTQHLFPGQILLIPVSISQKKTIKKNF